MIKMVDLKTMPVKDQMEAEKEASASAVASPCMKSFRRRPNLLSSDASATSLPIVIDGAS